MTQTQQLEELSDALAKAVSNIKADPKNANREIQAATFAIAKYMMSAKVEADDEYKDMPY